MPDSDIRHGSLWRVVAVGLACSALLGAAAKRGLGGSTTERPASFSLHRAAELLQRVESQAAASCAIYGCGSYNKTQHCQCNDGCSKFRSCCKDAVEQCGVQAGPSEGKVAPKVKEEEAPGSCASYGCGDYNNAQQCQCNSDCLKFKSCCADAKSACGVKEAPKEDEPEPEDEAPTEVPAAAKEVEKKAEALKHLSDLLRHGASALLRGEGVKVKEAPAAPAAAVAEAAPAEASPAKASPAEGPAVEETPANAAVKGSAQAPKELHPEELQKQAREEAAQEEAKDGPEEETAKALPEKEAAKEEVAKETAPEAHAAKEEAAATEKATVTPTTDGPKPVTFYMYRAQSAQIYPLENLNAADLAGVMWYLHNEVIVSTPRKYSIDRIRRYRVTLRNTQEFWNTHHRLFGAFLAFDAARCTTPICGDIFKQYGFIVGCQILPTNVAPYLGGSKTQVNGACKDPFCNAPVWYSLPGQCPTQGLRNNEIAGNKGTQDVMKSKEESCIKEQPGGRCDKVTGSPDCTYSVEGAGEIMLDELVGIKDYEYFWSGSYVDCARELQEGSLKGPCPHNKEFDVASDKGVGCSFWDGKAEVSKAAARMKAVRDLFKKHYPEQPYSLEEPPCDFDMYYDGEFNWKRNHTNAVAPSRGFSWTRAEEEAAKAKKLREQAKDEAKEALATSHATSAKNSKKPGETKAKEASGSCEVYGCGDFRPEQTCQCNSQCMKFHSCCPDAEAQCLKPKGPEKEDATQRMRFQ